MLFSSHAFIFAFLPLSLVIYHGLRRCGLDRVSIFALTVLSLFLYGWWNPIYLLLIIPLVLANFALARFIQPINGRQPKSDTHGVTLSARTEKRSLPSAMTRKTTCRPSGETAKGPPKFDFSGG